jgi:DsbC/DsbD-like thiol-disulfide interchange protein
MMRFLLPLILICYFLPAGSRAEAPSALFEGKGLTVKLVSDVTSVAAGQTFHLGLWLRHEPGYHTYWQNPGLAGVPTRLVPALPAGFTAGGLIYPPPDKVKMAAINVHGYERDVLVALPVTAPATLPAGSLTIPVEATWMCCRRTCNPGFANMALTLNAGPAAVPDAAWAPKFQDLLALQPPALKGWTLSAKRFEKEVELTLQPPAGMALPESPQFFSSDNLICSHPPQAWQKDGSGCRVRLTISDFQPGDQTHLRGLLFGKGSWQGGKSAPYVSIVVPLEPGGK